MNRNRQRHRLMRIVAKVRMQQPQKPFTGCACRGEYQQGQRYLRGHHYTMRALAVGASHDPACS
jgi:hypothetical protein